MISTSSNLIYIQGSLSDEHNVTIYEMLMRSMLNVVFMESLIRPFLPESQRNSWSQLKIL